MIDFADLYDKNIDNLFVFGTRFSSDREMIKDQTAMYHKYNDLVREGTYYRLASFSQNHRYDCYMVVSEDMKEALVTFVQVIAIANHPMPIIKLQGLDPDAVYEIEGTDKELSGDVLMNIGLPLKGEFGDFKASLYHLIAK